MIRTTQSTLTGFKVRVIRQSASPIEHALEEGRSVFIGCGDSCGIQVKGDDVAEIHCLVDVEDDIICIQDWASKAGTKVNGTGIDDKTPIQVGDSIVIGSVTLELVGAPSGQSNAAKLKLQEDAAKAAEQNREDSVGMEDLGYEGFEGDATAVADPSPLIRPSQGRLSDSFADPLPDSPECGVAFDDAVEDDMIEDDAVENCTLEDDAVENCTLEDDAVENCTIEVDAVENCTIEVDAVEELSVDTPVTTSSVDEVDDNAIEEDFAPNNFSADDLDWDPSAFDDDQVDVEIVQLLKSEIEDLRIQIAERDEQLAAMEGLQSDDGEYANASDARSSDDDFGGNELVGRVDDLLAELAEHDERVSMLQELLQTAEIQNQAEREERGCLENWVGEIEQRIGEREAEWQAEQDGLRNRLESVSQERDQFQQQLHSAVKRYGNGSIGEVVPDETLKNLQTQNAELQTALEDSQKQSVSLTRQVERLQNEEPEELQEIRADLAKEKASVSRMRFQLSKQLQEIDSAPAPKDQPDREFAYKLQTLREHLREIHAEEKVQREQKGESLLGRISNLWKRVDDEF